MLPLAQAAPPQVPSSCAHRWLDLLGVIYVLIDLGCGYFGISKRLAEFAFLLPGQMPLIFAMHSAMQQRNTDPYSFFCVSADNCDAETSKYRLVAVFHGLTSCIA